MIFIWVLVTFAGNNIYQRGGKDSAQDDVNQMK